MIEMHTEEPFDDDDASYSAYPGLSGRLWAMVWSAPALGITSLVLGLAALTIVQAADEIGETSLFSSSASTPSDLTEIRTAAAVRLALALLGVLLAAIAGVRLLTSVPDAEATDDDESDDEIDGPLWLRAVVGAGFLVSLFAALLCLASLIYALQAKSPPSNGFG